MDAKNRSVLIIFLLPLAAYLLPQPAIAHQPKAAGTSGAKISFAGKWIGTLRIESQDSYRGNNAKGEHRISSARWVFEISADERSIVFYPADWKAPAPRLPIVRKDGLTLRWSELVKASMSAPMALYAANGRQLGTGTGLRPDFHSTWTMGATSEKTAMISCDSNREDAYARITKTHIAGTVTKM
jgi:hypothetical protein